MSSKTSIEWTDESHNPGIYGCSHYGIGCVHCYAETMAHRLGNMGQPAYQGATEDWRWTRKVRTVPVDEAVASILNLPRRRGYDRPVRTFVTSMADMLHESIPAKWTAAVIVAMNERQDRTFQVLTHRGSRWPEVVAEVLAMTDGWPLNVWAGVSASNQAEVDAALPGLGAVPGVRFVSLEPLLGPVDLAPWIAMRWEPVSPEDAEFPLELSPTGWARLVDPCVHWIIVGGESGPKARPMHDEWAQSLRDQAQAAGVPFLFKQWGEWLPEGQMGHLPDVGRHSGHVWLEQYDPINEDAEPEGYSAFCVGKHAAGRLLDGRTWDEVPTP